MRRLVAASFVLLLILIAVGLNITAIDPDFFSGQWYYSADQRAYLFQEGLIISLKQDKSILQDDALLGAYIFSKDTIYLFVKDIAGLESEKKLYLLHNGDGSFLCENSDGSGEIYFIRYNK